MITTINVGPYWKLINETKKKPWKWKIFFASSTSTVLHGHIQSTKMSNFQKINVVNWLIHFMGNSVLDFTLKIVATKFTWAACVAGSHCHWLCWQKLDIPLNGNNRNGSLVVVRNNHMVRQASVEKSTTKFSWFFFIRPTSVQSLSSELIRWAVEWPTNQLVKANSTFILFLILQYFHKIFDPF